MSWFERWLSRQEMTCAAGKEPSLDKVESFCQKAEGGKGCPNLFPEGALKMKPETVFGKRKAPKPGINLFLKE